MSSPHLLTPVASRVHSARAITVNTHQRSLHCARLRILMHARILVPSALPFVLHSEARTLARTHTHLHTVLSEHTHTYPRATFLCNKKSLAEHTTELPVSD